MAFLCCHFDLRPNDCTFAFSTTPITTPKASYQYISLGTPKDNVLELERLFLNEKLKSPVDSVKKKRKVPSNGFFFQDSVAPPTIYTAPTIFSYEKDDFSSAETLKELVEDDAIDRDDDIQKIEVAQNLPKPPPLDDLIIKSIEDTLKIHVPNDNLLRHRNKTLSENSEEVSCI